MKRELMLNPMRAARDPFTLLRQMTSELDRVFDEPFGFEAFRWPTMSVDKALPSWAPQIDVFERDGRLVTKVDLPGMKKEDVKVEVTNGYLVISGERKNEFEEKKENRFRTERAYGTFYRAVPLPEKCKPEDVKASFADGVLEVTVPVPPAIAAAPHTVAIEEPKPATLAA
jgi:HSP20 family protein